MKVMRQCSNNPKCHGRRLMKRLMIKNYPNRGASVKTMKAHIDKLRATGFIPHLIIVDYADLLKPVNKRDGL